MFRCSRKFSTRTTRKTVFYFLFGQIFQEKWYKDHQKSDCVSPPSIDLSRIPVNKGIKSRLGWTKYSDLYEIVHQSLDLISSCLLTGEECRKGLFALSLKTFLTCLKKGKFVTTFKQGRAYMKRP